MRRRTRAVVVLKAKLFHTDNIMPLLFTLYQEGLLFKPVFIAPSRDDYHYLRCNKTLMAAVQQMSGRLVYVPGGNWHTLSMNWRERTYIGRMLGWLPLIRFFLFRRVLLYDSGAAGVRPMQRLFTLNQWLLGGRRIFCMLNNLPFRVVREQLRFGVENWRNGMGSEAPKYEVPPCDVLLSSFSTPELKTLYGIDAPQCERFGHVGYARGFPNWAHFLDRYADKECAELCSTRYVFFPLSIFKKLVSNGLVYDFEVDVRVILRVLSRIAQDVKIVIRPHPTTNESRARELIDEAGLKNYEYSMENALVLLRRATLMVHYGVSTLDADAYYMGCPCVAYQTEHPEMLKRGFCGGFTNHYEPFDSITHYIVREDEARLEAVLQDLLSEPPKREEYLKRFPPDDFHATIESAKMAQLIEPQQQ